MIRSKLVAVGAAVLASTAAAVVPASSALAYISPPLVLLAEAQGPALLVTGGAAVDVPVEYSCSAESMYIGVQLVQAVKKQVASGSGSTQVPCDGRTHRVLVRVRADGSGVAFAKGNASATTDVYGCTSKGGSYLCGDDTTERTVKLKK
jgi:hypothetical protein